LKKFACIVSLVIAAPLVGATLAEASAWTGKASYYGGKGRTASGGHVGHLTAAHRSLPFGTKLRVTNLHNKKSVVVTVNDRGPFVRGRIVDVSTGAAGVLGMKGAGVAPVRVELVSR
jgi:rare lipoprotein A